MGVNKKEINESNRENKGREDIKLSHLNLKSEDIFKAVSGVAKFTLENPKLKGRIFNDYPLFLNLSCIKIPKGKSRILRIPLDNPLTNADSNICLIVAERKGIPNKEHDKHLEYYEDLLRKHGIRGITKIMTFHEFRTEYETFEMKQRLVQTYDAFLADAKICGKVVQKGGKIFYKKRKIPIPVKLNVSNLKGQVDKCISKTSLFIHQFGDSYTVQFGHNQMPVANMVENVFSILKMMDQFPGGFDNIRHINVFAYRGMSIPIYTCLKNQNDVPRPQIRQQLSKRHPIAGDISTRLNTEVVVHPTGEVSVKKATQNEAQLNEDLEKPNTKGPSNRKKRKLDQSNREKQNKKHELSKKIKLSGNKVTEITSPLKDQIKNEIKIENDEHVEDKAKKLIGKKLVEDVPSVAAQNKDKKTQNKTKPQPALKFQKHQRRRSLHFITSGEVIVEEVNPLKPD